MEIKNPPIYMEESLTEDEDIAPSEITEKSTTEPLTTSPELQSELETDRPDLAEDEKSIDNNFSSSSLLLLLLTSRWDVI